VWLNILWYPKAQISQKSALQTFYRVHSVHLHIYLHYHPGRVSRKSRAWCRQKQMHAQHTHIHKYMHTNTPTSYTCVILNTYIYTKIYTSMVSNAAKAASAARAVRGVGEAWPNRPGYKFSQVNFVVILHSTLRNKQTFENSCGYMGYAKWESTHHGTPKPKFPKS